MATAVSLPPLRKLFSLKSGVILCLLGALVWGDQRPQWLRTMDDAIANLSWRLAAPSSSSPDLALITLPSRESDALSRDLSRAESVSWLVKAAKTHALALLLDQPMQSQLSTSDQILARMVVPKDSDLIQWQQRLRQTEILRQRVITGELMVGLPEHPVASFPETALELELQPAAWMQWPWLPQRLVEWMQQRWLAIMMPRAPQRTIDPVLKGKGYLPFSPTMSGFFPLLWLQESRLHPGLELELFARQHYGGRPSLLRLNPGPLLQLGDKLLPIDRFSSVRPAPLLVDSLPIVSWQQALQSPPKQKLWLVGSDLEKLRRVAQQYQSLVSANYYYRPYWSGIVNGGGLILATLYCLLVLPRLSRGVAALVTLLLVLSLLLGQLAFQMLYSQELPLVLVSQWLFMGYLVGQLGSLGWRLRHYPTLDSKRQLNELRMSVARDHIDRSHFREAFELIKLCDVTEPVLHLGYEIAVAQERQRQYQQAAATYHWIAEHNDHFKDASTRAQSLQQWADSVARNADFSATQTMAMPSRPVAGRFLGRYEIQHELGRGAMGIVYLGVDSKIARDVAIKTLSFKDFEGHALQAVKQRFFREAEAAGKLNHPNIITIYDVGEESDLAYIAMDYVAGCSLDHCVSSHNLLALEEVYFIVVAVAEALDYAHQQHIVHRDIKPGNIIYDADTQQVKVADFGIARIVDESKTKTGEFLGSPVYMAPEHLKGHRVTGACDIYSLGVTFYQLLTGVLPFRGDNLANLAYQILNKKSVSVREIRPELPPAVVRIVNKAMHKDPLKRYPDAAAFADAVRQQLLKSARKKAS